MKLKESTCNQIRPQTKNQDKLHTAIRETKQTKKTESETQRESNGKVLTPATNHKTNQRNTTEKNDNYRTSSHKSKGLTQTKHLITKVKQHQIKTAKRYNHNWNANINRIAARNQTNKQSILTLSHDIQINTPTGENTIATSKTNTNSR